MTRLITVIIAIAMVSAGPAFAQFAVDPEADLDSGIEPETVFIDRAVDIGTGVLDDDEFELVEIYRVREGDRISITVFEDPSLNRTVLIRPDGRFNLPLAGSVVAAGRTPEEIEAEVRRLLSRDFVTPPNVTVSLVGLGRRSRAGTAPRGEIFMMGEIRRRGRFRVALPITIMQALAVGGGPARFAAESRIQVRRKTAEGAEQVILFDYAALQSGSPTVNDFDLADGDIIFVPQRRLFE